MGAADFTNLTVGADAEKAFSEVRKDAQHERGHGGYSGTIAEKGYFVVVQRTPLTESEAYDLASRLMEADDPRISDKWGPAGAIPVKLAERHVAVKGVEGTLGDYSKILEVIVARARAQRKIRRGEKPVRGNLTSYSQKENGVLYSRYGTRPVDRSFTQGTATLTLAKAPEAFAEQTEADGWLFFGWASS